MKTILLSGIMKALCYSAPRIRYCDHEREQYRLMLAKAARNGGDIAYICDYPKYRFLQYVVEYEQHAVLDRSKVAGIIRNGCLKVRNGGKFYFFSITKQTLNQDPWTDGMIYLLPRTTFERSGDTAISFEEWTSAVPVKPIARLKVDPEEFVMRSKISIHYANEPLLLTWLLYKLRTVWRQSA